MCIRNNDHYSQPPLFLHIYFSKRAKVRVDDVLAAAKAFGGDFPMPPYDTNLDINCNGKIRVDDIVTVAANFGWTKP